MDRYLLFALLLCFSNCISIGEDAGPVAVTPFFDVEKFLDDELVKHNLNAVRKEVSYNGEVETSSIQKYDLTADFEILKSININNPNWSDKYHIDTVRTDASNLLIRYEAKEDQLPIRSLETVIINLKPIGFKAISQRNALVADSKKLIDYNTNTGYSISTETKSVTSDKRLVTIIISYNPS